MAMVILSTLVKKFNFSRTRDFSILNRGCWCLIDPYMTTVDVSVIDANDCVVDVVANHGADMESSKDHCLDYPHVDGDIGIGNSDGNKCIH